jgi:tRNA(fMet)-specific endonuclease VapC
MRGWLSFIAKARTLERQVVAYERLQRFLDNYRSALVLPFEEVAAIQYARLRGQKLKLASMDLKIAAVTIANDALLISRNLSDFSLVPDLRVADWTR